MSKFLRLLILAGALLPSIALADTTTRISATIMTSSCQGVISADGARGTVGRVDFGTINPKFRNAPVKMFSLILKEFDSAEIGCRAFDAYAHTDAFVILIFGDLNNGQLDEQGVITRYEDGRLSPIRVRISPTNSDAHFATDAAPKFVTQGNNILLYPVSFTGRGQFNFQASLVNVEMAEAGKLIGTLTLTLVYQ